jgi:hypothetical protein
VDTQSTLSKQKPGDGVNLFLYANVMACGVRRDVLDEQFGHARFSFGQAAELI